MRESERAAVRIKQMREARALQLLLHMARGSLSVSLSRQAHTLAFGAYQHFALHRYARHTLNTDVAIALRACIVAGDKVSRFTSQ